MDIHNTNPAEEMNFLGYVDGTPKTPNKGANFGYPDCFSVWDTNIPKFNGKAGQVIGTNSANDTLCANNRQAPRLVFAAHSAPIDILFDDAGTTGWITFRGSDIVTPTVGYGLGTVKFRNGNAVASVNSKTALTYIAQSKNLQKCRKTNCWAPVGLAWDSKGRLFMSTDYTGEIYVILRSDGSGPNS